nr:unnamed protein product [Digitaria exilis]
MRRREEGEGGWLCGVRVRGGAGTFPYATALGIPRRRRRRRWAAAADDRQAGGEVRVREETRARGGPAGGLVGCDDGYKDATAVPTPS